jgi:hypothetical protein
MGRISIVKRALLLERRREDVGDNGRYRCVRNITGILG